MKRATGLLLAFLVTFGLLPVTGSASTDTDALFPAVRTYNNFSDVQEDAWYTDYVAVCYETGLMEGKQNGLFDPEGTVTLAEAATVTARFHNLFSGGDGVLPSAPDRQDIVSFLDESGQKAVSFDEAEDWVSGAGVLYLRFSQEGLAKLRQQDDPAGKLTLFINSDSSLTSDDQYYQGEYRLITGGTILDEDPWEGYVFDVPNNTDPSLYEQLIAFKLLKDTCSSRTGKWYLNTQWYFCLHYDVFQNSDRFEINDDFSTRNDLFSFLAAAVPDHHLAAKNNIVSLPDTQNEDVLAFYNAGVLTGIDQYGTFAGGNSLTRAELAAMLARIIRPSMRVAFSPERLAVPYTLTPLSSAVSTDDIVQVIKASGDDALLSLYGDNGLQYLCDWSGNQLTQPIYDEIDMFGSDGLAAACRDGLWGYLGLTGREVIPCIYPYVTARHDGVLLAGDGENSWTVFDANGKATGTLPANVNCSTTLGGYIQYQDSETGKYGYLSSDGSIVIPAAYSVVYPFSNGYFAVGSGQYNKGFIDLNGTVVVPLNYPYIFSGISDGLAIVGVFGTTTNPLHYDGKYGAVNTSGNVIVSFIYSYLGAFSDGLAPFLRKTDVGSYVTGYVASDGTERITSSSVTAQYNIPAAYSGGYALSPDSSTNKYGYANTEGAFAIPAIFTNGTSFSDDGAAVVEIGSKYYLLIITNNSGGLRQ